MSAWSAAFAAVPREEDARGAARWFWMFTIGHVALWTLATCIMMPNVTLDVAEMVYWGHEWQWGYFKHPPLPAWIAEACYLGSGNSLAALFLAARVCIALCFWGVWQLARRYVSERLALLSVVALEASYYFTYEAHDINNNTVTRPFWVLAVLALHVALFEKRFWAWLAAGACLGIAMLGKYDTALLALIMLGYSLWDARGRQAWKTAGPYAMLATALLVFSPHLAWLIQNDFPTLEYVAMSSRGKAQVAPIDGGILNHVIFPAEFFLGHIGLLLPVLAICAGALRPGRVPRQLDDEGQAKRRFLLVLGLGPAVGFLLVSALCGVRLSIGWGHHLWTWAPLILFMLWETDDSPERIRPLLRWCLAVGLLFMLVGLGRSLGYPYLTGRGLCRHFPGAELARQIEARWHEHAAGPLPIIGGNGWTASNIGMYSAERPHVYCELNPHRSPWVNDETLTTRGGVIVWQEGKADELAYAEAAARFPQARLAEPIVAHWQTGAQVEPIRFNVAIIPPADPNDRSALEISSTPGAVRR